MRESFNLSHVPVLCRNPIRAGSRLLPGLDAHAVLDLPQTCMYASFSSMQPLIIFLMSHLSLHPMRAMSYISSTNSNEVEIVISTQVFIQSIK